MSLKNKRVKGYLNEYYNLLKYSAADCLEKGNSEGALKLIEKASSIAYDYNFKNEFSDDQLETELTKVAAKELVSEFDFIPNYNRVVFYDYFGWPNRGLTQQYLSAIIAAGYEILFVVPVNVSFNRNNEIYQELVKYRKAEILDLSHESTFLAKAKILVSRIISFGPHKAFLHLAPWDVTGIISFIPFKEKIVRYNINLTDQAFWLGKCVTDFNIEYRNYGYQLSSICRKIPKEKLIILPYYPILQNPDKYKGFPIDKTGKIVGVSGGSGYKFLGESDHFFKLIFTLLKEHPEFVFMLIGIEGGVGEIIRAKIKAADLEERFLLLPNRDDIFQLLLRCDIFFSSYPQAGGLMTQVAAIAGLPIVAYNKTEYYFNEIPELLPFHKQGFQCYYDDDKFNNVSSRIITDPEFRKTFARLTKESIISKETFDYAFKSLLEGVYESDFPVKELNGIEQMSEHMFNILLDSRAFPYKTVYSLVTHRLSAEELTLVPPFKLKKFLIQHYMEKDNFKYLCLLIISKTKGWLMSFLKR